MAVSWVDVGAVATASPGTSLVVATPAGSIGDLVVFVLLHDDYSDGPLAPITPPITLTEIDAGSTQLAMDARARVWQGVETQATTRNFTFGTLSLTEEIKGVCLRFAGQGATPILASSIARKGGPAYPSYVATKAGQMVVAMLLSDTNLTVRTPVTGWTERVDSSAVNYSINACTKPVTTEDLSYTDMNPENTATSGLGIGFVFVIDHDDAPDQVAGVTRDNSGAVLVSSEVSLFKEVSAGVYAYVDTQVSDGTTGDYSFDVWDTDAAYMVYGHKSGSPNVFDASDNVLTPT